MTWVIILAIAAIIVIAVAAAARKKPAQPSTPATDFTAYTRPLMTPPEQVLYHKLRLAQPDKIILAQVALSQIVKIKRGPNQAAWQNKVARKSVDFAICRKNTEVVAVIELDDKTHERADRQKADRDKDAALTAAGIKIIRWRSMPDDAEIKAALDEGTEQRITTTTEEQPA